MGRKSKQVVEETEGNDPAAITDGFVLTEDPQGNEGADTAKAIGEAIGQSVGKTVGEALKVAAGDAGLLRQSVKPFVADATITKQNYDIKIEAQKEAERLGHTMPVDPQTGRVEWYAADPAVQDFFVTTCPMCGSTIQARWHASSLNDKAEVKAPFPMIAIIAPGGVQFGRYCPKRKMASPISTTGHQE